MNLPRRNMRTEELRSTIRKLDGQDKPLNGSVKAVYQRQDGQDAAIWKPKDGGR